jgi:predicted nucleotide-binding protein
MPFNKMLTDRVSISSAKGGQVSDISASVQKDKIFIQRSDILIEVGDVIERKMSNGGVEHYEVIEPGFHEKFGSIPAGYQMSVKRSTSNLPISNKLQSKAESINPKVFIVHGHDDLAKITVARFIEQVGLNPIILHEQASSSKTIIEKIESYGAVGFAIVLYTPCDVGAKSGEEQNPRARQNVVFEHGYFIGRLGRSKVAALVKGKLETPNDISGVVYIDLDERGAWKMDVAKELREAGYSVDLSRAL